MLCYNMFVVSAELVSGGAERAPERRRGSRAVRCGLLAAKFVPHRDVWGQACMYVCMYVRTYVRTYVCSRLYARTAA